jgi:hypothetical protein
LKESETKLQSSTTEVKKLKDLIEKSNKDAQQVSQLSKNIFVTTFITKLDHFPLIKKLSSFLLKALLKKFKILSNR